MSYFTAAYQAFTMLMFLGSFQGRRKYVMFPTLIRLKGKILHRVPANISQDSCSTKCSQRNTSSLCPMYSVSFTSLSTVLGELDLGEPITLSAQRKLPLLLFSRGERLEPRTGKSGLEWKLIAGCTAQTGIRRNHQRALWLYQDGSQT